MARRWAVGGAFSRLIQFLGKTIGKIRMVDLKESAEIERITDAIRNLNDAVELLGEPTECLEMAAGLRQFRYSDNWKTAHLFLQETSDGGIRPIICAQEIE